MTEQQTMTPEYITEVLDGAKRYPEDGVSIGFAENLADMLAAMTQRAERAEAVVEKLPLTADRVRVVPMTDPVYLRLDDGQVVQMTVWANGNCAPRNKAYKGAWIVSQCYSTPEAAQAAIDAKGGASV